MFDLGSYEFMLMALVALIVIGPKDLPNVLRFAGKWIGKARGIMAQFRMGIDDIVRETELKDIEKQWQAENERIMREFPDDAAADVNMNEDASGEAADKESAKPKDAAS